MYLKNRKVTQLNITYRKPMKKTRVQKSHATVPLTFRYKDDHTEQRGQNKIATINILLQDAT